MTFSCAELNDRRLRAVTRLQEEGLDALVVSLKEHLTYLTGLIFADLDQAAVGVVQDDGALTLWLSEEAALAAHDQMPLGLPDMKVVAVPAPDEPLTAAGRALRERGRQRIGYEGDWYALSFSDRDRLYRSVSDAEWREATHLLTELRLVKSPDEIAVLRRAAKLADEGMAACVSQAAAGVRELDLAAAAQAQMLAHGSEYSSFPGLVGSGPRSGLYHPLPTARRLEAGDAVEIETTGSIARYNSNLVRTVFVTTASPEQRDLYEIVREAFEAGFGAVAPGRSVGDVDAITRKVRERYADYIPSRAGYGIELSYPPFLTGALSILVGAPHTFQPGMVFSLEPSIAGFGEQTVILGCNVLVTDTAAEILHHHTRDMLVVG